MFLVNLFKEIKIIKRKVFAWIPWKTRKTLFL